MAPATLPAVRSTAAGVFIGGMDGVEAKWRLFRALPVGDGPAGELDRRGGPCADGLDRRYRHVFRTLLPP